VWILSGVKYNIPRDHLKKEKQVCSKIQLNEIVEDSERKAALRCISKSAPSRRAKLMAALLDRPSEGSLNKRKRMVSSPCKKTSPHSARRKANHNSMMQPVATAIFR
jgi:ubiquitin carboxyl-terminal hydrolase 36/42